MTHKPTNAEILIDLAERLGEHHLADVLRRESGADDSGIIRFSLKESVIADRVAIKELLQKKKLEERQRRGCRKPAKP